MPTTTSPVVARTTARLLRTQRFSTSTRPAGAIKPQNSATKPAVRSTAR